MKALLQSWRVGRQADRGCDKLQLKADYADDAAGKQADRGCDKPTR